MGLIQNRIVVKTEYDIVKNIKACTLYVGRYGK